VKAESDADADYDRAARELAFEAKGQVRGAAGGSHKEPHGAAGATYSLAQETQCSSSVSIHAAVLVQLSS